MQKVILSIGASNSSSCDKLINSMKIIYSEATHKVCSKSIIDSGFRGLNSMVKKTLTLALVILITQPIQKAVAQNIPNPGFESWTNGLPNGWFDGGLSTIGFQCIVKSTDVQTGTYALKIKVDGNKGEPISGSISTNNFNGIPTNLKPAYLIGYIKTNIMVADTISVGAIFYKDNIENDEEMGGGFVYSSTNRPSWTAFYIPLMYSPTFTPDSFFIFMGLNSTDTSSFIMFDDLSFSNSPNGVFLGQMPTGLAANEKQQLISSVFPNPATNELEVVLNLESINNLSISLMDITGKKCKTFESSNLQDSNHLKIAVDDLVNGIYLLNISGSGISSNHKVVISR